MIVACAEAGILGCMPSLNARTADALRADLAWIRSKTDRAFGINLTIGLTAPERVAADMALALEYEVPGSPRRATGNPTAARCSRRTPPSASCSTTSSLATARRWNRGSDPPTIASARGRPPASIAVPARRRGSRPKTARRADPRAGCIRHGRLIVASLCARGARALPTSARASSRRATECGATDAYKAADRLCGRRHHALHRSGLRGIHANFIAVHRRPSRHDAGRMPDWREALARHLECGPRRRAIHAIKLDRRSCRGSRARGHDALAAFA